MITSYDNSLSEKNPHLKNYPNYLPHISAGYATAPLKILVVAESHYLNKKYDDKITTDHWYDNPVEVTEMLKDNLSGMNTRAVINDFNGSNRTIKPYRIFLNLEAAYQNVFTDRNLFKECAYINYFQRPAEKNGQSIRATARDHKHAFENLSLLIDTIKPDRIIFTSRKAFDSYKSNVKEVDYKKINVVPHPASAWWNKKSPRYGVDNVPSTGREKFIRIISQ